MKRPTTRFEGEHDVARGFRDLDGLAHTFRSREGNDQRDPYERNQQHLEPAPPQYDGTRPRRLTDGRRDPAEEGNPQAAHSFAMRGEETPDE